MASCTSKEPHVASSEGCRQERTKPGKEFSATTFGVLEHHPAGLCSQCGTSETPGCEIWLHNAQNLSLLVQGTIIRAKIL